MKVNEKIVASKSEEINIFKILLVDDRTENLLTLENIIEQPGRIILKALSGNEALKRVLIEPVDLILLDVQMPDMDGYEVADLLRLNPKTKNIPIIFVSAVNRNEKGALDKFEEGTVDFLFKPLDIIETKSKVTVYEKICQLTNDKKNSTEKTELLIKEMDHFVYLVSHDLKAPLRAIDNLVSWIEEDISGIANKNLSENIALLKNRVTRMQNLFDGITELSRASRINESKEQVQLNHLVQYVIDTLTPPAGFIFDVQNNMPSLFTEKTKLLKTFTHLINNAIMHHHKKEGVIRIYANEEENNILKISVSDDGPGIKPQYHEKVFEIFHTLQPKDKHETSGVGLTIVKKIVESFGQKVWFDKNNSIGTTVHFTWKK